MLVEVLNASLLSDQQWIFFFIREHSLKPTTYWFRSAEDLQTIWRNCDWCDRRVMFWTKTRAKTNKKKEKKKKLTKGSKLFKCKFRRRLIPELKKNFKWKTSTVQSESETQSQKSHIHPARYTREDGSVTTSNQKKNDRKKENPEKHEMHSRIWSWGGNALLKWKSPLVRY